MPLGDTRRWAILEDGRRAISHDEPEPADLTDWSAHALRHAICTRRLSSVEVITAFLDRIDAVNGLVNAMTSRVPRSDVLAHAAAADRAVATGAPLGRLHGLPIAVKDLIDVAGLPTTHGAVPYAKAPPAAADSLLAERLRSAGVIFVGKTNTPEYGLGTVTYNDVFGPTRNPWDLTLNAGGSSGGAAAAVAAGMLPFADGSDSGGSIRYPAAFCNLVGLRTSPGRIPMVRRDDGWSPHGVFGPIARSARDAGLLLSALAGPDTRSPIAIDEDPQPFADVQPSGLRGMRVAWSRTGGGLPIEPEVTRVLEGMRAVLVDHGAEVEEIEPDLFDDADEAWQIIEMMLFFEFAAAEVERHGETLRGDLVRNVAEGGALTSARIIRGLNLRTEIYRKTVRLLENYDVLALPSTPVVSVGAEEEWPREVAGVALDRYFVWQRLACRVTVTAHPALSLPAGFSADELPVGLQLVGRHRGDLALLRQAAAIERATGFGGRRPQL